MSFTGQFNTGQDPPPKGNSLTANSLTVNGPASVGDLTSTSVTTASLTNSGTSYAKRLQVGQSDTYGGVMEQIGGGVFRIRPVQNQDGCSMLFQSTQFSYRNAANQTVWMIDPVNNNLYYSYLQGLYIGDNQCSSIGLTATKSTGGTITLNATTGVTCNSTLDRTARFINARSAGAGTSSGIWQTVTWTGNIDANNTGLTETAGTWKNVTGHTMVVTISYSVSWDANASGSRFAQINRHDASNNPAGTFASNALTPGSAACAPQMTGTAIFDLVNNGTFTLDIMQNSGANINFGQAANGTPAGQTTRLQVAVI